MRVSQVVSVGLTVGALVLPFSLDAEAGGGNGLRPGLRHVLAQISSHFGRPVEVSSGCRSARSNRMAGGRKASFHLRCMAADIRVAGVSEGQLLRYVRSLPGVGGVGTYCRNTVVHVDIGPKRRWSESCGRRVASRKSRRVQVARR
jgi:Peptidase M15